MSVSSRGFLAGVNHLLSPAPWARQRLSPHAGRAARLRAEPFEILISVQPDGYLSPARTDEAPAVTLSLPLGATLGLVGGDASKAMSEVRIDGNAEFADALGFVFRNLRWDAEEDLSKIFGDILARRIVLAAKAFKTFNVQALEALGGNLGEYFTEEQKLLVTHRELADHGRELGKLRDGLARLEKRVQRTAGKLPEAHPRQGIHASAAPEPPAGPRFLPLD